jgi:putative lipoic acid-binding regulatory protein
MSHDTDALFDFPCDFPIKALGRADSSLAHEIVQVVRRHAPDIDPASIRTTPSANGNYVSVTVTITAHSREQLDAIYLDLNAHEAILMTL